MLMAICLRILINVIDDKLDSIVKKMLMAICLRILHILPIKLIKIIVVICNIRLFI